MNSNKKLSLLLLISIFLISCDLYWLNPLSDIQSAQTDERLIGTWVMKGKEGESLFVRISEKDDKWMQCVFMSSSDETEEVADIYIEMYSLKLEERTFLNMKWVFQGQEVLEGYRIAEYEIKGEDELIWRWCSKAYVKKAIEDKMLSGETEQGEIGSVIVLAGSPEIKEFIRNSPKEKLFPESQSEEYQRLKGY